MALLSFGLAASAFAAEEAGKEEPKKEEEPKKKTKPKKEEPKKEEPKKKTGLLLVVNLHGQINVRRKVRAALRELQIDRRFSATVVRDEPSTVGLLDLSRDYVAWAPLEEELLASLLKSRAKVSERRRLDGDAISKLGFKGTEELASKMMKDEMRLSAVKGLRPFFNLSPPRGGFKVSTRRKYGEGGVLGMNPELSELVRRMI